MGVRGVQEGARTIYTIGRQLIYTAIGIASGFASMTMRGRGEERPAKILLGIAITCGVLFVFSSLFSRPRSR